MANWGYVAIDKTGKEIKGSRDADTQEALTRDLKQQGLIVLEVKQQNTLTRDINISFDKILPAVCQHRACRCQHH